MFAILRQYAYEPTKHAHRQQALAEVQALHAAQPGYAGSIIIDDDQQRLIAVNLWETEHAAAAGRAAIGPQVQQLLEPLMGGPSELIAAGRVTDTDLTKGAPREARALHRRPFGRGPCS